MKEILDDEHMNETKQLIGVKIPYPVKNIN